jgi:ABC-type anion transport system duplicated permease subunit
MTKRRALLLAMFLAAFPISILFGIVAAACFGPEVGANLSRYSLGVIDGVILAAWFLPTPIDTIG